MTRYDLLVIGSGPAGQRGAIQAAKLGKRVAIIERWPRVGGVSVHTGTLPSKTLRDAILYLTGFGQRGIYGDSYQLKREISAADLMERLALTLDHEIGIMEDQLARNHIEVVRGTAAFVDPHTISVTRPHQPPLTLAGETILIATGTRPRRPDHMPFNDDTVVDSDGILGMRKVPKRLIVVGAGIIGMEYATMFHALGVEVTVLNERERLLDFLDRDLGAAMQAHLVASGMQVRSGVKLARIEVVGALARATLAGGETLDAELLLYAAGRIGCTSALALERAGLNADARHHIPVNDHSQTAVPHIYAAGDVIGFPALASTSMEQGRLAVCHALGQGGGKRVTEFPIGIYTVPEISLIGQTEQALAAAGIDYVVGRAQLRETARGQIRGVQTGMLKLLVARAGHKLLGVHILGEGATELIHLGQAVLQLGGTVDYFVDSVFNYPTYAEAYKTAALDAWNRLNGAGV
jgi:NAD(P) transhydrogenase